jgi:cytochrome bd-type quinol oxidase subunit 2
MKTVNLKRTSILATLPILLFGILWLFEEFNSIKGIAAFIFFLGSIFLSLIYLGIGWVKNFPKWTLLSIGFSIIMCLYLMNTPCLLLNRTEVLGIFALVPLLITLLISFLVHPSTQPLKQLYYKIKEEISVLFFIFYGILLFILYIGFDEIHHPFLFIYPIILITLTITTSILYLENKSKSHRKLILFLGTLIPVLIAIFGILN